VPATVRIASALLFAALLATPGLAAPRVVATIKPIHSIASNVMAGIAEPELLLDAAHHVLTLGLDVADVGFDAREGVGDGTGGVGGFLGSGGGGAGPEPQRGQGGA